MPELTDSGIMQLTEKELTEMSELKFKFIAHNAKLEANKSVDIRKDVMVAMNTLAQRFIELTIQYPEFLYDEPPGIPTCFKNTEWKSEFEKLQENMDNAEALAARSNRPFPL